MDFLKETDSGESKFWDAIEEETKEAEALMGDQIYDGISVHPDASPSLKLLLSTQPVVEGWTSDEDTATDESFVATSPCNQTNELTSFHTPETVATVLRVPDAPKRPVHKPVVRCSKRLKLDSRFPCRKRTGMSLAVDTAWHKRGFDSLTSHTFFMSKSKYGKKVVKTVVSHRTCATCKWWKKHRPFLKVRKHRCLLNHNGSARSMESVSGVKGVKELEESGISIEYIEGDGDNTLVSKLQSDLNKKVKKRFDRNHVVKNITKRMYHLQQTKNKKLSKSVITHIQKCLTYCLAKNQGNQTALEENLKALIPHQFGDHSQCAARFCGFIRKSTEKYIYHSLPYKAALRDDTLRDQLQDIFQSVLARAEDYTHLGSSQQCEHANREVTLRVPKHIHYGSSEALDFRVHATSAFINEGRSYIAQANKELGLSPGKHTLEYAEKQYKRRVLNQKKAQLPSTKRHRLIRKQERAVSQGAKEALEGQTYEAGIGHEQEPDIEQLPEPVPRGDFKPIKLTPGQEPTPIMFDLETTDLIRGQQMPHITQIAAVEPRSGATFNSYVKPKVPISNSAEQVTGIVVSSSGMTVHGKPVSSVDLTEAVEKFMKWLEQYKTPILVAHNGRRFDCPVFMSALMNIGCVDKFCKCVSAFSDSIILFRKVYPDLTSYKQEDLVSEVLGISYAAHDAVEDVQSLGQLFIHANLPTAQFVSHTFTSVAVHNQRLFNVEKAKNIGSLGPLIYNGIIKTPTAENIAGSGLKLHHLRVIFKRDGEDGLLNTFICKNNEGQPRVTSAKRTLETVIPKLVEFFSDK